MSPVALRVVPRGLLLLVSLVIASCAARGTSEPLASAGRSTVAGEGGDPSEGGAPNSDGGAPDTTSRGGKAGMTDLDTNPNGDGGAPDGSCAAQVTKAQIVPLDMYIMLDASVSMTGPTSTFDSHGVAISKWDAVRSALHTFIEDQASADMSVGLQYFPIVKPNLPASCSSDEECGDAAPCQFHMCSSSGRGCVTDADCGSSFLNTCVLAGECGDYFCGFVGDTCNINGIACTKLKTSTCQHTVYCDPGKYAAPARPIAPIARAGADLLASIDGYVIDPDAETPTGPALSGAIEHAKSWAKQHPNHRVVALLVTDGLPTDCSPNASADLGQIAAAGLTGRPSVNTFTIGVFGGEAFASGQKLLNTIAESGGTKKAFVIDASHDVAREFRAALDAIRSTRLACEFTIPEPRQGERVDYSQVNVNFENGKKSSTLLYVADAGGCDPLGGGWYYDTDPEVEDPARIVVCPSTCTTFETASNASVQIAVGCQTIVK